MTPSETVVTAAIRNPKGVAGVLVGVPVTITLTGVLSLVAFYGNVTKAHENVKENTKAIEKLEGKDEERSKRMVDYEKKQAELIVEVKYLKDTLKEFRFEQKQVNQKILDKLDSQ